MAIRADKDIRVRSINLINKGTDYKQLISNLNKMSQFQTDLQNESDKVYIIDDPTESLPSISSPGK